MTMTLTAQSQPGPGQLIPLPSDFPVKWTQPDQARKFWILDRMHFPEPVLPLMASISETVVAAPFNKAVERYALPIRLSTLYINSYLYLSFTPVGVPPDFVLKTMNAAGRIAPGVINKIMGRAMAGISRKYMAQLEPVIERLGDHWHYDWLPELKQHLAYWENFDLSGSSMPHLLAHLDETLKRLVRIWEIHHLLIFPTLVAINQFDESYRDIFDTDDPFEPFRLLQGFDNKFLEADRALWQLSRQALTLPKVYRILMMNTAVEIISRLEEFPEGQIFLSELQAYLDEYGQRGHKTEGLNQVSWIEDPTPVIQSLQDYVSQSNRDLEAEQKAAAAEREQFAHQVRTRLQGYSQSIGCHFETLLKAAQVAVVLHEEHNYWIDQRCQYQMRRVMLEFGRRFTQAGVLDQPDEVFYLTMAEVRETAQLLPRLDRHELVKERQAPIAHFCTIPPPPAIGTVPLMKPPDDPFGRAFGKVFGSPPLSATQADPAKSNVLRGLAGSPGVTRGRARVIRSLSEVNRLQQGEVLIVEAAMPPWTSLFATISAIVTDVGGVLSHCAIVAREYGIPAVVGVGNATTAIRDGQLVEVDGNRGVVHILNE
jgi:pyruvate,water dikinase